MKRFTIPKKEGGSDIGMLILLMQHLSTLKDGTYDIIIEDHHAKASHKQFGWLFGGIYPRLIPEFNNLGWEMTSTDDVDAFFASAFRSRKSVNRNTGEVVELPQSLSEMNTVEMTEFIHRVIDFCTENFNVDITELLPQKIKTIKQ